MAYLAGHGRRAPVSGEVFGANWAAGCIHATRIVCCRARAAIPQPAILLDVIPCVLTTSSTTTLPVLVTPLMSYLHETACPKASWIQQIVIDFGGQSHSILTGPRAGGPSPIRPVRAWPCCPHWQVSLQQWQISDFHTPIQPAGATAQSEYKCTVESVNAPTD